jgi:hypothetical protein
MCAKYNQIYHEIIQLYNMVIMHDIKKICAFIYNLYHNGGVGWMLKASCGKEGEGSNPTLNML